MRVTRGTSVSRPLSGLSLPKESEEIIDGRGRDDIITTLDKVRICLNNYRNFLRWQNDWWGVAGLIITTLLALLTSDFKDTLGIPPIYWKFGILSLFILLVLRYSLKLLSFLFYINESQLEAFIDELRTGSLKIRDAPSIETVIANKISNFFKGNFKL